MGIFISIPASKSSKSLSLLYKVLRAALPSPSQNQKQFTRHPGTPETPRSGSMMVEAAHWLDARTVWCSLWHVDS
jgi:hypothetical protein